MNAKNFGNPKTSAFFKLIPLAMSLFILSAGLYPVCSFSKPTLMYGRSWNKIIITGKFKEQPKWHYLTDIETRLFSRNTRIFDQEILRQGFGYSVSDKTTFWAGGDYQFLGSTHQLRQESRIWTQLLYKSKLNHHCHNNSDVDFTSRTRLEQRFANHRQGTALRLRQQLQLEIPILNNICPSQYKAVLFDEVFVNLNRVSWVAPYLINQNRILIGFSRSFCDNTSITFGYLNQYVFRRENNHMNHIAYLVFKFN